MDGDLADDLAGESPIETELDDEAMQLWRQYVEESEHEKYHKGRREQARQRLIEYMRQAGATVAIFDSEPQFGIRHYLRQGLDTARLEADHPALVAQYQKHTKVTELRKAGKHRGQRDE